MRASPFFHRFAHCLQYAVAAVICYLPWCQSYKARLLSMKTAIDPTSSPRDRYWRRFLMPIWIRSEY